MSPPIGVPAARDVALFACKVYTMGYTLLVHGIAPYLLVDTV